MRDYIEKLNLIERIVLFSILNLDALIWIFIIYAISLWGGFDLPNVSYIIIWATIVYGCLYILSQIKKIDREEHHGV